jgi:serine/threonine protein phosphatase PrpC
MQTWLKTAAGVIRDQNQDVVVLGDDRGFLIIADGFGAAGRSLAETAVKAVERVLRRPTARHDPARATGILAEALADARAALDEERWHGRAGVGSGVHLGLVLVADGHLAAATTGTCGLLLGTSGVVRVLEPQRLPSLAQVVEVAEQIDPLPPNRGRAGRIEPSSPRLDATDDPARFIGPIPLQVGDWVALATEGFLVSTPLEEVARLAPLVGDDPERFVEVMFQRAGGRYDGDDRSFLLARFLPGDLERTSPRTLVLDEGFHREYRVPIWVVLLAGLASALGWLGWRSFLARWFPDE